jgi:hypothetical protein
LPPSATFLVGEVATDMPPARLDDHELTSAHDVGPALSFMPQEEDPLADFMAEDSTDEAAIE